MTANDERHPRDLAARLETAAGYLADANYGEIVDDLREAAEHFRTLRTLAGLVSTAAAKHTGESQRARAGDNTITIDKIDRNAVGRLHNAAKNARRTLDAGACAMCKDAGDSGVDVTDRSGTCAECGRGLGLL